MAEESSSNIDVFVYTEGAVVPEEVYSVRIHPSVTVIPEGAFRERYELEDVELCEGLLEIERDAFRECYAIQKITIPSTVIEIGSDAFRECISLKNITIPSTITIINEGAFAVCESLEEVELREGLLEIGICAFGGCGELRKINIPSTVTSIGMFAFEACKVLNEVEFCEGSRLESIEGLAFYNCTSLKGISLPDSIENIGSSLSEATFNACQFTTFRIPSLVTTISAGMFSYCTNLFSVEMPEGINKVHWAAFIGCPFLRNVALPQAADFDDNAFIYEDNWATETERCKDLLQLCATEYDIEVMLKVRFDNLPIHKMIYYQSYNNMTVEQLNEATTMKRRVLGSNLNPTGNLQDGLGMTPLHILACSATQNLELYKVLVTKYPENLITKDRWGDTPLLYAVLRNAPTKYAPSEIVQFLVESYKSFYPNHEFDWNEMVLNLARFETLAFRSLAQHDVIRYVWRDIQQESFSDQHFDWNEILEEAIIRSDKDHSEYILPASLVHLVRLSISERANRLWNSKFLHYNRELLDKLYKSDLPESSEERRDFVAGVQEHLVYCEEEYRTLKEATTLLELVLWKKGMNDHCQEANEKRRIKRTKIEESTSRQMCRVGCGADVVIRHVLPFLVRM